MTVLFILDDQHWTVEAAPGATLLEAAWACGAPVATACQGKGVCVQCRIKVSDPEGLAPPTPVELDRMGNTSHLTGERMACQARVLGSGSVEARIIPARVVRKGSRR